MLRLPCGRQVFFEEPLDQRPTRGSFWPGVRDKITGSRPRAGLTFGEAGRGRSAHTGLVAVTGAGGGASSLLPDTPACLGAALQLDLFVIKKGKHLNWIKKRLFFLFQSYCSLIG